MNITYLCFGLKRDNDISFSLDKITVEKSIFSVWLGGKLSFYKTSIFEFLFTAEDMQDTAGESGTNS